MKSDDNVPAFGVDVSPRDTDVVRAIEEEELSLFTFDGLRRITGSHPETLSRTLDRLEEGGIVVRTPDGYAVTGKAKEAFGLRPANTGPRTFTILHTYLPYDASAGKIVAALRGRWFDNIRWVGMSSQDEGVVMKWVTDDGTAIIDARFASGELDIEARVASDSDLPKAVRAAHQLVGRISRLYSSPRPGSRVALMQIGRFTPAM
ncbi:MAG: hypothetical protein JRM80_12795 [Nitrososphaerota archaeon]|nr:hypothetical protein [Nitrososphaerota archaeon]